MNKERKFQELSEQWSSQQETASITQKNKVGIAFITEVLNLDKETALKFVQGDTEARHTVGMAQAGIPLNGDFSGFWNRIHEIFPNQYEEKNIEFLKQEVGVTGILKFLYELQSPLAKGSPVLKALAVNAHVYK